MNLGSIFLSYNLIICAQFNILGLPNEMISHIFSFLPIADRLRARLNRRLSAVEAETKYYVDRLVITEVIILYIYFFICIYITQFQLIASC